MEWKEWMEAQDSMVPNHFCNGQCRHDPYLQLRGSQGLVQFPELCFPPCHLQLLP